MEELCSAAFYTGQQILKPLNDMPRSLTSEFVRDTSAFVFVCV